MNNKVNNVEIMNIASLIDSYRSLGYKSTASAIAELVDNSIQAEAKKIRVMTFEVPELVENNSFNKIQEIGIYDDGVGMDDEILLKCLVFGEGTRKNAETGLGKYGVGLPQASISQSKIVKVFTWQNGKCKSTYLSVDEVKTKNQLTYVLEECEIPHEYLKHVDGDYDRGSGTFILWTDCDEIDFAYSQTLYERMQFELCRIYRHFLDDNDDNGTRRDMGLIEVVNDKYISTQKLMANDPLYRLTPNNLPKVKIDDELCDYSIKPSNIEFARDIIKGIPWKYLDKDLNEKSGTANVEIIYTHIDPWIRRNSNDLGNTEFGKHYGKNMGISFVRDFREIDFGKKGFYANSTDPTLRFLGIEVRFPPSLDKLFGVSNTKQSVRFKKTKDSDFLAGGMDNIDYLKTRDPDKWFKRQISNSIALNMKSMKSAIDKQSAGKRGGTKTDPTQKAVDLATKQRVEETLARINKSTKSPEEIIKETTEKLKQDFAHLPQKELDNLIEKYGSHEIIIEEVPWPGEIFIECNVVGSAAQVKINTRHKFYENVYKKLEDENVDAFMMLRILLYSYGQATQELTESSQQEVVERLNSKWGLIMHAFAQSLENLDSDVK
jgi:hypothetical protein